jgi:protein-L-isoaspartate(D-aspartate) O-methyltransferase
MQGAGTGYEQRVTLAGEVHLAVESGPALSQDALSRALAGPRTEIWSGVTVNNGESHDTLNLHLATVEDRAGTIWKEPDSDLVTPAARWYTPALVESGSFAYLTARPADVPGQRRSEFGVHAYGQRARELEDQLTRRIQEWDTGRRHHQAPGFTLYPAGATVASPADGKIFTRRHTQIALTWT